VGKAYLEQYKVYASRYGASVRTIKRWVADGAAADDVCPLDEPVALRDWWGRRMKQRVPAEILAAAAQGEPLLELPVQPVKEEKPPEPIAPRVLVEFDGNEQGIQFLLKRAQQRAAQAHDGWMKAKTEEDAAYWERRCKDADEAVRKITKDATDEEIKLRAYIPRLEAETQITEFHMDLLTRIRGLGEEMARALGIPPTPTMEERWQGIVDELCLTLQTEIFTAPLE
jgi:hypothetical protein